MTGFHSLCRLCAFGLGVTACLPMPHAAAEPLTIYESAKPFGAPGFKPLVLTAAPLGSVSTYSYHKDAVSFDGLMRVDGIVRGSKPGDYTAPALNAMGKMFKGKYLSTGDTGFINIAFAKPQQSLSLLWGSVDTTNEIEFLNNNQVVATLTGADVESAAAGLQGAGGSLYVLINSALSFDDIEVSSGIPSFELARLKSSAAEIPVNEPASLALFGSGFLGLVGFRRLRSRSKEGLLF